MTEYVLRLTSIISVCACLLHDVDGGVIVLISTKAFGNCPSSELTNLVQAEMDNSLQKEKVYPTSYEAVQGMAA